ncbi:MAG: ACP S-malonyltransferase [Kineosporiaceae bacterium]
MLAILCPGQGSQTPGMLAPWLELPGAADLIEALSAAAGLDLAAHGTTSDADTIRDTSVAQPLITATSLLCLAALVDDGASLRLDDLDARLAAAGVGAVAGHSVGEFAAAAAAGVLTGTQAVSLVATRGRAMAQAAAAEDTGMAAVLGGDPDEVLAALSTLGLTPANVNGAGQVVAAGPRAALDALAAAAPARARVIPLQVAGAFHTATMAPAVPVLAAAAEQVPAKDPQLPLLSNADGEVVTDGADALARLVSQVSNPVRWDLCQQRLAALGVATVVEPAPAGTLANLAKRALPGVAAIALKGPEQLDAARAALHEAGAAR